MNGFETTEQYLDYESKILSSITQDTYQMAVSIVDAWTPSERLRVDDKEEFRDQLINLLEKKLDSIAN